MRAFLNESTNPSTRALLMSQRAGFRIDRLPPNLSLVGPGRSDLGLRRALLPGRHEREGMGNVDPRRRHDTFRAGLDSFARTMTLFMVVIGASSVFGLVGL